MLSWGLLRGGLPRFHCASTGTSMEVQQFFPVTGFHEFHECTMLRQFFRGASMGFPWDFHESTAVLRLYGASSSTGFSLRLPLCFRGASMEAQCFHGEFRSASVVPLWGLSRGRLPWCFRVAFRVTSMGVPWKHISANRAFYGASIRSSVVLPSCFHGTSIP